MKHYLYISDDKLEWLYPQIKSEVWARLRGELGFSFFVNAKVSVDGKADKAITDKLDAVVSKLRKEQRIGTISEPKEYFSGTMVMRSSNYAPGMILYGGIDEETRTTVALGGSSKHLAGNLPEELAPDFHTGSDLNAILFHLGLLFADHNVVDRRLIENNLGKFKKRKTDEQNPLWWAHFAVACLSNKNSDYEFIGEKNVLDFIANSPNRNSEGKFIGGKMPRIKQKVNFVAKKLLYEDYGLPKEEKVLIGTPLYIALAE